ncbi:hypothetical protein V6Z12_D04G015900 [Gossypium hirsutum]
MTFANNTNFALVLLFALGLSMVMFTLTNINSGRLCLLLLFVGRVDHKDISEICLIRPIVKANPKNILKTVVLILGKSNLQTRIFIILDSKYSKVAFESPCSTAFIVSTCNKLILEAHFLIPQFGQRRMTSSRKVGFQLVSSLIL